MKIAMDRPVREVESSYSFPDFKVRFAKAQKDGQKGGGEHPKSPPNGKQQQDGQGQTTGVNSTTTTAPPVRYIMPTKDVWETESQDSQFDWVETPAPVFLQHKCSIACCDFYLAIVCFSMLDLVLGLVSLINFGSELYHDYTNIQIILSLVYSAIFSVISSLLLWAVIEDKIWAFWTWFGTSTVSFISFGLLYMFFFYDPKQYRHWLMPTIIGVSTIFKIYESLIVILYALKNRLNLVGEGPLKREVELGSMDSIFLQELDEIDPLFRDERAISRVFRGKGLVPHERREQLKEERMRIFTGLGLDDDL